MDAPDEPEAVQELLDKAKKDDQKWRDQIPKLRAKKNENVGVFQAAKANFNAMETKRDGLRKSMNEIASAGDMLASRKGKREETFNQLTNLCSGEVEGGLEILREHGIGAGDKYEALQNVVSFQNAVKTAVDKKVADNNVECRKREEEKAALVNSAQKAVSDAS